MEQQAVEQELGLGDHLAFFFKTNDERLQVTIPYVLNGLRRKERCVYVAVGNSVSRILTEFERAGIDIGEATSSGALSVVTKHESYLRHGIFEPERMIADWDREVRFALEHGFAGLRATADMSWALDLPSALRHLLCDYEDDLCRRWPGRLGGMCQYDETLFSADVVQHMCDCHCAFIRDGRLVRKHKHESACDA